MRITEVTVFTYRAQYAYGTYVMSGGRTSTGQDSLVLRLRTDEGIEGWGESAPLGSDYLHSSFQGELAALKELSKHLLGLDPRTPAAVGDAMDRAMLSGTAAKSLIDFACWDILGRSVGLPTHTLLGGCVNTQLRAFTVIKLSDSIEDGVQQARGEVEKGVAAMQVKVGADPRIDARRVRAIREAVPENIEIWADANAGWTFEQALVYARTLGQDVSVPLEQPCRSLADCAEVGRRTGLPINLDECVLTMRDLLQGHAAGVTGINLKLSRVGGMTKARAIRDVAVSLDMMVTIDDTWGCSLLTAQMIQLAATTRSDRLRAIDLFTEWVKPAISDDVQVQSKGMIGPTTAPGNGYGNVNLDMLGEPLYHCTE